MRQGALVRTQGETQPKVNDPLKGSPFRGATCRDVSTPDPPWAPALEYGTLPVCPFRSSPAATPDPLHEWEGLDLLRVVLLVPVPVLEPPPFP